MAEADDLYAGLEANPGDPAALAALADRLEADGQTEPAACVRWLAGAGRVPFRYPGDGALIHHFDGWNAGWYWWATEDEMDEGAWGYPEACRLPPDLWGRMKHSFDYDPRAFKDYPTSRAAIEAVIAAWKGVPTQPARDDT